MDQNSSSCFPGISLDFDSSGSSIERVPNARRRNRPLNHHSLLSMARYGAVQGAGRGRIPFSTLIHDTNEANAPLTPSGTINGQSPSRISRRRAVVDILDEALAISSGLDLDFQEKDEGVEKQ